MTEHQNEVGELKTIRYASIVAAVVYLSLAVVAFLLYPQPYGPTSNWLSDLGDTLVNTRGAAFYNAGCIGAAILTTVVYINLNAWRTGDRVLGRLLTIGQIAGVFSSVSLVLSAIFTIGASPSLHSRFSMFLSVG